MISKNIDLIKELHLDSLPEDQQKELMEKMGQIVHQKITLRVMDELSDEDKKEFDKLLQTADSESNEVLDFLKSKIPNLETIAEEEVNKFKQEASEFIKSVIGE